jgi:hypothetical protein
VEKEMSCDPRYAGDGEPYGEEEEAKELRDITDAVGESGRESGHQLDREVSSPMYIGQWRYDEKHVQFNARRRAKLRSAIRRTNHEGQWRKDAARRATGPQGRG